MSLNRKAFSLKTTVHLKTPADACTFLAEKSRLSKSRIKDAMNKGAVWIRKKGKTVRLRRATTSLKPGDLLELHYDEALLKIHPPEARLIHDAQHYSVWYKPPGLMAQGTPYGDHCSLVRQAELFFSPVRPVFLVHRLDREASGVMLIAHSKIAAAALSRLFQTNSVRKEYRAEVLGNIGERGRRGKIEILLDGKEAATDYEMLLYEPEKNISTIRVYITTGRLHQIRRHFAMFGFPVMGDPRYGKGNKNRAGLRLSAVSLSFLCPFSKREGEYRIPEDLLPF